MPKTFIFTKVQQRYIKKNYLVISGSEMAKFCGCSKGVMYRYLKKNGLEVPKNIKEKFRSNGMKGRTTFTDAETKFIRDNYLNLPVKSIAAKLGRSGTGVNSRMAQLGLVIPEKLIEKRKQIGRFQKGDELLNKGRKQTDFMRQEAIDRTKATRFKKGSKPHNTTYNGHERVSKDGYIEIRTSLGVYRHKHVVEWEKANGEVQEGFILVCRSDNKLNFSPDNWEMISREENMLRNSRWSFPEEIIPSMALISRISNTLNKLENGKEQIS
ncbi:hypothetical protein LCGC14_1042730 [marine sediment metagenome]|uniref:HNH endonuclease n=2 Tax=root TaxID=1 RepID=A0A831QNM3_9FLAO|nr:HNH endonuclease [Pricia antarctica]